MGQRLRCKLGTQGCGADGCLHLILPRRLLGHRSGRRNAPGGILYGALRLGNTANVDQRLGLFKATGRLLDVDARLLVERRNRHVDVLDEKLDGIEGAIRQGSSGNGYRAVAEQQSHGDRRSRPHRHNWPRADRGRLGHHLETRRASRGRKRVRKPLTPQPRRRCHLAQSLQTLTQGEQLSCLDLSGAVIQPALRSAPDLL